MPIRHETLLLLVSLPLSLVAAAYIQWDTAELPTLASIPELSPATAVEPYGFPAWLRITHYVNFMFLILIIRSGLQILMDHPRLYWNVHCTPGTEWLRSTPVEVPRDQVWTPKYDSRHLSPWIGLPGYRHTVRMARHWRLFIDSWRWQGVPWCLRSGQCLAETAHEVLMELRPPPQELFADSAPASGRANYLRFRLSPSFAVALAARVKHAGKEFIGDQRELYLVEEPPGEESPYERLLGDAMAGDGALFTREEAVEAAWAVVEPVLRTHHRTRRNKRGSWGPIEADSLTAADGCWNNPKPEEGNCSDTTRLRC